MSLYFAFDSSQRSMDFFNISFHWISFKCKTEAFTLSNVRAKGGDTTKLELNKMKTLYYSLNGIVVLFVRVQFKLQLVFSFNLLSLLSDGRIFIGHRKLIFTPFVIRWNRESIPSKWEKQRFFLLSRDKIINFLLSN